MVEDASPIGLSAVLLQKEPGNECPNIVAYASRALLPVEKRWKKKRQRLFTVVYKAGISNPADFLSRHPVPTKHFCPNVAEEYEHFVTDSAILTALTIKEINSATEEDKRLRGLRVTIQTGCWNCDIVKPFTHIHDQIPIDHRHNILLRGTRIVLPNLLQQ